MATSSARRRSSGNSSLLRARNRVEERAGDVTASAAGVSLRLSLAVGKLDKRRVVSGRGQRRVVELVAA